MMATKNNVPPSSTLVMTILVLRTSPSRKPCTLRSSRSLPEHRAYIPRPATSENSCSTTFVDKGRERLLFPVQCRGCCARGTYVKSRSWPGEHLRSNRWEDAVGFPSCRTSENAPSTALVNTADRMRCWEDTVGGEGCVPMMWTT